jgi:hypothetical protein
MVEAVAQYAQLMENEGSISTGTLKGVRMLFIEIPQEGSVRRSRI